MNNESRLQFDTLAGHVANVFAAYMRDDGYATFSEMRKAQRWSTEDIKDECEWIIDDLSRKVNQAVYMTDDHDDICIGGDLMGWNEWSKLLYKKIREAA